MSRPPITVGVELRAILDQHQLEQRQAVEMLYLKLAIARRAIRKTLDDMT